MGAMKNQKPEFSDSFILVNGNTFKVTKRLKELGFKFDWDGKFWHRGILEDKYWVWETLVGNLDEGINCAFSKDLIQGSVLMQEFNQMEKEAKRLEPAPPHELDGSIFEVSKWYSNAFKENNNTEYAFRNLRILKVKKESAKAYCVDAEFYGGIASRCGACGLPLNNDISRATGIGPICAGKMGLPRPTMETAKEIVKMLEEKSKAQGVFEEVWIPKSQIKEIIGAGE